MRDFLEEAKNQVKLAFLLSGTIRAALGADAAYDYFSEQIAALLANGLRAQEALSDIYHARAQVDIMVINELTGKNVGCGGKAFVKELIDAVQAAIARGTDTKVAVDKGWHDVECALDGFLEAIHDADTHQQKLDAEIADLKLRIANQEREIAAYQDENAHVRDVMNG